MTQPLKFNDEIGLQGILDVSLLYADGKEDTYFRDENLIMDRAKSHLLSLVYDTSGSVVTDPIQSFRVGSGGVFSNTAVVREPDASRNTLFQAIALGYPPTRITHNREDVLPTSLSASSPRDVTFSFSLTPSELVGAYISEVGLFTRSGFMFNHKTFPALYKTTEFTVLFRWTLRYL
jgi:hypothetical protein